MTTSIAGDEPPRSNTAHANVSRTSAVDQQAREAPNLSSKLEVGDASVVNNLSGVPALATASQQGPPISSTAAAAAAGPDHADISPAKDPLSRGTAIAQDQQPFDVKATSNGETMPDSSPSYPIPIQPAQALDLPTVPASSGQVPPANGANASGTPPESNVTGATEVCFLLFEVACVGGLQDSLRSSCLYAILYAVLADNLYSLFFYDVLCVQLRCALLCAL